MPQGGKEGKIKLHRTSRLWQPKKTIFPPLRAEEKNLFRGGKFTNEEREKEEWNNHEIKGKAPVRTRV